MDEKIIVLANEIADQAVKSGCKKVAVTTLEYKDCNSTEFGKLLAERLTGKLSISGRNLVVVNQKFLAKTLEQNKLTAMGLLETTSNAGLLQKALSIDGLVYGSITSMGEEISLSLNIVKLPTLAVLGHTTGTFPLTNSIKEMLPCIGTLSGYEDPNSSTDPNPTPSKDKNCAKNHKGEILFINNTQKDVLLEWSDSWLGRLSIVVRAGGKHLAQGLHTINGSLSYNAYLYRNIAKKENPEQYPFFVEECLQKSFVIK